MSLQADGGGSQREAWIEQVRTEKQLEMTSDASLVLTIRGPLIIRARIVGIPGCPWLMIRGAKIAMVPIPSDMCFSSLQISCNRFIMLPELLKSNMYRHDPSRRRSEGHSHKVSQILRDGSTIDYQMREPRI
ncbi:hypothetical protein NC653_005743 [Populus alba x Populus x berolinensis]|uniref:Uncharacterized protein n=1 Tax=Populus alba x Populus x berolinensis TaxID=444605 RepID=A0AAD6RCP8_9ROSI|nr:hypothetical protein NC653_005743 [Populus alba x Populus x berolinensis]